ncbi:MAG: bifunctional adenosylcobinamide kinase/adenosylcobinamide-phosphate guanylyltransferase [Xenococcaceae cyanobacterium MO_207.B15]|nr:bifunctional adenosylcobinamide kinase/adenosylcobinamide-phosphate guanylyltransferase [Xenococcaceae cyanobacterium MO_207.B15]MDJ0744188.1 bifunctional adenosylcobinamide kinase/adenosylcobinamide-phosphate guanylyltransferase [Xenococcaceae cyanobacterium MO_167.B27]
MNSIVSTSTQKTVILVTGASRSGKSEWAETLAEQSNQSVIYVATAIVNATDPEWQSRIIKHQQRRPKTWQTLFEPYKLAWVIRNSLSQQCLLIDSLGTWVANFLDLTDNSWIKVTDNLHESIALTPSTIIFVGEETGWGVVPAYASGRLFRDRLGHLLRQIGSKADTVYLVTGGHAINLSILGTPLEGMSDER